MMENSATGELAKFIKDQLSVWPLAAENFRSIKTADKKQVKIFNVEGIVQHNPCRITSSTAETDEKTIAARKCFLCPQNRPKEQFHIKFQGRKSRSYNVQVNPFPIFPGHLVIVRDKHIPQAIWHHLPDILEFVSTYPDRIAFYNGPESGASAPDHLHFQACARGYMPLEIAIDKFLNAPGTPLATNKDAEIFRFDGYTSGVFALKSTTSKSMAKLFYRLLCCCSAEECEIEPRFNLFAWHKDKEYRCFVVMRGEKRSHHYYDEGPDHLTMSPGAADMAGFIVAPLKEDFIKADSRLMEEMLSEVAISEEQQAAICWRLSRKQPWINVKLAQGKEMVFEVISDGAGPQRVMFCDGRIAYNGMLYDELYFDARTRSTLFSEPSFIIEGRKYAGGLKFIVEGDSICAVNHIGVENYLLSVISDHQTGTDTADILSGKAIALRKDALEGVFTLPYSGIHGPFNALVRNAIDSSWGITEQK